VEWEEEWVKDSAAVMDTTFASERVPVASLYLVSFVRWHISFTAETVHQAAVRNPFGV
jgi:hypothetical protein